LYTIARIGSRTIFDVLRETKEDVGSIAKGKHHTKDEQQSLTTALANSSEPTLASSGCSGCPLVFYKSSPERVLVGPK
jgi:hypothetical protein